MLSAKYQVLVYSVSQSELCFDSGGQNICLDCFLPSGNGRRFPAVIGLHGSGGGHASMAEPAGLLATQGFAVYVLHYFDRTGTTEISRSRSRRKTSSAAS